MDLHAPLKKHFGFKSFRDGQEAVVRALLAGKSALALFPTGAGKSLCYQLPAVLMEGTALVVSPLIALMKDQVEALQRRGIKAARLDSSLGEEESAQVLADLASGALKLLYVAPERLSNETFIERLKRAKISLLAIDEAHCISEWGHNFRPEYLRLALVSDDLGLKPVLALTATATPEVAQDVCRAFHIAETEHVQTPFERKNLFLRMTPVTAAKRLALLTQRLQNPKVRPAIVYVTLQQTAEDTAGHLARSGLKAKPYHAGLPDEWRSAAQEEFMRGEVEIIVATIAFGMGIDKADIRSVFHFNLPKTLENYQQETGRAGRDGKKALCEMLACADDRIPLENFTYGDTPSETAVQQLVDHLLRRGTEFDISRWELSQSSDIRPLVVETVLTQMELEGLLKPVRAFYESFQITQVHPEAKIIAGHTPERREFLTRLFASGKRGWKHITLKLGAASEAMGEPRDKLLDALTWLEEAGDIVLKPSGIRHAFRLTPAAEKADPFEVGRRLHAHFALREERDAARLQQVIDLACEPACLTRRLLAHFGETTGEKCGHCENCRTGFLDQPRVLPASPQADFPLEEVRMVQALIAEAHPALRTSRQLARFLCGITSPSTIRAKLTRKDAFALWEKVPFLQVLERVGTLGAR